MGREGSGSLADPSRFGKDEPVCWSDSDKNAAIVSGIVSAMHGWVAKLPWDHRVRFPNSSRR